MEVICLETQAFYALIEEVVDRLKAEHNIEQDRWIPDTEAMRLLGIKSKTTLQKLRDTGSIRFSKLSKKLILYCRDSIMEYLEKHAQNTFWWKNQSNDLLTDSMLDS